MESDRRYWLAAKASARGLVDFSQARPNDQAWWTRYSWLVQQMEADDSYGLNDKVYRFQLALLSSDRITSEDFEAGQQRCHELYAKLIGHIRPWEGTGYREQKGKEFDGFRQAYIDNFGVDPMDPRFKQWEAEQIARLQSLPPEVDEERELMEKLRNRNL